MSAMIVNLGSVENVHIGTSKADRGLEMQIGSRARDIEVTGSYSEGDIYVNGIHTTIEGARHRSGSAFAVVAVHEERCTIHDVFSTSGEAAVYINSLGCTVNGLQSYLDTNGIVVTSAGTWCQISNAHVMSADETGVVWGGSWGIFDGVVNQADRHGIEITGSSNRIGGQVYGCGGDTNNTYDNITILGAASRNLVTGAVLRPRASGADTRSAVNIGGTGECNMVVGNDLGDPDDYGTDAIIDTASNTQLFWPADATYGDNFTDCGSGS